MWAFFNLTPFYSCFKLPASSKSLIYSLICLADWNGMGKVLAMMLQLVKLCIIGFAVIAQGSKGSIVSSSLALFPVIPPRVETLGPIYHGGSTRSNAPIFPSDPDGLVISPSASNLHVYHSPSKTLFPLDSKDSWRTIVPSSPAEPDGSFFHPPNTTPSPASAPTHQRIKDIEPSISPSPSTIALSPPFEAIPSPPTVQGNLPPSVQASPPQGKTPFVLPISTPTAPAPVAFPSGRSPKISPVSQPTKLGNLAPNIDNGNGNKSHTAEPVSPSQAATPYANSPTNSSGSQPNEHGNLAPNVDNRNGNKSHTAEPISQAPTAAPATNSPKNLSGSPPTEHGSFPPKEGTNKGHSPEIISPAPTAVNLPKNSPVRQPHQRNGNMDHALEPVSPASFAIPPATYKKNSTVSQPTQHGGIPPNVRKRIANKGHTPEPVSPESVASSPRKVEHNPPLAHPIFPKITPSILPEPVTSPNNEFPVNPPIVHSIIPAASPSKLPEPVTPPTPTPLRSVNWKKGGAPVASPSYEKPKPLPAVIQSPAQAPAAQKERKLHPPPEPLIPAPKSPSNNEYHSPALSPSTSLPPTNGQRHLVPPPMNSGPSFSPFSSPSHSNPSGVSPAPSPSIKLAPHPTKMPLFPPIVSPSESSSKSPEMPLLPKVQALPPPPPNEDCLSTVCSEPYANSPPGSPCRCVWPMRVGLRLSVSLYTFFPLVSELASEISTGVFMKQSQVRIMGANAANQHPEKTVVLIDLVPLGEKFDKTTAFATSDRFWHKKVLINAYYFGDYDVLYVSYPGLPPSPPLPPSSIPMIDGGPFFTDGNNGGTIKPLGVDVQKRQHKGGLSKGLIAIISVSVFLAVVLFAAVAFMFKFRDHVSQPASTPRLSAPSLTKAEGTAGSLVGGGGVGSVLTSLPSSIAAHTGSAKTFSVSEIEKATDNFHASRILGEGGFGRVYSGILEEGMRVAVKVLMRDDHHGDREFFAEVEMLSRLHHRNLVKLIGICTENSFRCLVYELIPNGSVESHLHAVDRGKNSLDWGARMKIALGAARGLAYLHEDSSPCVIHRDFKSSNILLEDDFTPKVSDFGLARAATGEENRHISTRVMGTFGYVAPEYAMTGHLLVKSDVYSYGVVLLELLTGRKPVDMSQAPGQENLVTWARPFLTSKEGLEAVIDPSLGADVPFDSVAKVAAIASMCVQPEVSNRPFMGEVVQALKLVCNECEEAKEEAGSVELDERVSTLSEQLSDNFRSQYSDTNFDSGVDIENGLSASELFDSSARVERPKSGLFRRNSYSGPLSTGRSKQLWHIIRRLSGGSVSEHGNMFK